MLTTALYSRAWRWQERHFFVSCFEKNLLKCKKMRSVSVFCGFKRKGVWGFIGNSDCYIFWCFSSNPKRCFESNSRLMVEYSTKFALENILIFSAGKILLLWYENPVPFANFMYLGKLILCGNLLEKKFFFFLKHQVV